MRLQSIEYICCPACGGEFELNIKEKIEAEVVQGVLECRQCKRCFNITDGFPNLIFPESLGESDLRSQIWHDKHAERYDRDLRLGMLFFGVWEGRARRQLIDRLELEKNASVLETGTGTGSALPLIANQIGKEGRLDASDISSGILKVARRKMKAKGIPVELIQANASYLPYRTATFNAVLHIGGLNLFEDKKRAIEEMHRVAKPMSRIVICDEGLSPGKEKTWLGKLILKRDREGLFSTKPPQEFLPDRIEDLKIYWIWHDNFWVIEFRKSVS
jgi:ubiquinone/menaquinone biosynthesis C-methylase UbiE